MILFIAIIRVISRKIESVIKIPAKYNKMILTAISVSAKIIDGNVIANNAALTSGWYGEGGGIDDWGGSTFIASNNLIYGNTTNGEGGGIATWRANNARVFNNTFIGNTAVTGGGIYRHYGIYFNNIVVGNTATTGGGVYGCANTVCGYNDVW